MGLTNLEALISSLIGFYTRRAANGIVTTATSFKQLVTVSTPAQLVYISNTTGKTLLVSQDAGTTYLALPDGAMFPFNNIADLSTIWIKTSDNTSGIEVTYRYEY